MHIWMTWIERNTYNVELKWDVFVLRHSRRCVSPICDNTSMCRLTEEEDGPMIGFLCHRHFVGFLLCQSRHRHGATLFRLILKNRTPLSRSRIYQMIELTLTKYTWMPPLLGGVELQPQVHRCAIGIMLALWLEGRLFEPRCPQAIRGRTKSTVAQLVSCLPCDRKVVCSSHTVRKPLEGVPVKKCIDWAYWGVRTRIRITSVP